MENQIDTFLNQMMENLNDNINNNFTTNTTNATSQNRNNVNNSTNTTPLRYINRQLDTITNLITVYNYNQIEYQRNIQSMLALLQLNHQSFRTRINQTNTVPQYAPRQNSPRQNAPRQNAPRQNARNNQNAANTRREYVWTSYTNPQTNNIWNGLNNNVFNDEWTNILNNYLNQVEQERRLTNTEITTATRSYTFSDNISNTFNDTRCPISLEEFVNDDVLSEIRGCGHIFRRDNLLRWLRRSNCCPICRYNLLTQRNSSPQASPNNNNNNNTPEPVGSNNVDLSSNNVDLSYNNGFVYSFTTSFPTTDNSLNNSTNDIYNFYNQALNNMSVPYSDIVSNNDISDNDIPDNASVD